MALIQNVVEKKSVVGVMNLTPGVWFSHGYYFFVSGPLSFVTLSNKAINNCMATDRDGKIYPVCDPDSKWQNETFTFVADSFDIIFPGSKPA